MPGKGRGGKQANAPKRQINKMNNKLDSLNNKLNNINNKKSYNTFRKYNGPRKFKSNKLGQPKAFSVETCPPSTLRFLNATVNPIHSNLPTRTVARQVSDGQGMRDWVQQNQLSFDTIVDSTAIPTFQTIYLYLVSGVMTTNANFTYTANVPYSLMVLPISSVTGGVHLDNGTTNAPFILTQNYATIQNLVTNLSVLGGGVQLKSHVEQVTDTGPTAQYVITFNGSMVRCEDIVKKFTGSTVMASTMQSLVTGGNTPETLGNNRGMSGCYDYAQNMNEQTQFYRWADMSVTWDSSTNISDALNASKYRYPLIAINFAQPITGAPTSILWMDVLKKQPNVLINIYDELRQHYDSEEEEKQPVRKGSTKGSQKTSIKSDLVGEVDEAEFENMAFDMHRFEPKTIKDRLLVATIIRKHLNADHFHVDVTFNDGQMNGVSLITYYRRLTDYIRLLDIIIKRLGAPTPYTYTAPIRLFMNWFIDTTLVMPNPLLSARIFTEMWFEQMYSWLTTIRATSHKCISDGNSFNFIKVGKGLVSHYLNEAAGPHAMKTVGDLTDLMQGKKPLKAMKRIYKRYKR